MGRSFSPVGEVLQMSVEIAELLRQDGGVRVEEPVLVSGAAYN